MTYAQTKNKSWKFACFTREEITDKEAQGFIKDVLEDVRSTSFAVNVLDVETNWLEKYYQPSEILELKYFIIAESQENIANIKNKAPLYIRADIAFGSGGHGTTSGCLEALECLYEQGENFKNILDLGTGSGILAIASEKLWPKAKILATDCEEDSMQLARNHIQMNNCKNIDLECCYGFEGSLVEDRQLYDLVIANILTGPLKEMAEDILLSVRKEGHIILSGMLCEQKPDVLNCYEVQASLQQEIQKDGWSTLVLKKR
ncbi:MAG: 50S ribosomal protein L11 methyltransferase [Alphaproteobacteria bacterium]|nr:50S ribosomal protein L11 methyltransferase [Alphaproteobacteria bacterium]